MSRTIPQYEIDNMRRRGLLKENETAYYDGNVLIARDLSAGTTRVISQTSSPITEGKQVLCD